MDLPARRLWPHATQRIKNKKACSVKKRKQAKKTLIARYQGNGKAALKANTFSRITAN